MLKMMDSKDMVSFQAYLQSRSADLNPEVMLKVNEIINEVRNKGDEALYAYTLAFDYIELTNLRISNEVLLQQAKLAKKEFVDSLKQAKANIEFYHREQLTNGYHLEKEHGIYLGQRVIPLDSVGIYVPGGRAQYPSSVLMNAIPAKLAGVKRIVMITPPSKDGLIHPNIAAAALIAGVDEIYTVGGAQGIAALAYGSESIKKVDKIVGPGNIYVAMAKKLVFGQVDIDMIAGPSEILVIADEKANPAFVAADLLSQSEHDPMASSMLVTTSKILVDKVNEELAKQSKLLPKYEIIKQSLANYGVSFVCDNLDECIEVANAIASEHLELMVEEPLPLLAKVKHAGSVFLGYYTCESIGDYFGGTNHVLPTSSTARFSSALSCDAFVKKTSYLHYTKEALQQDGDKIILMANEEELQAHAEALKVRLAS